MKAEVYFEDDPKFKFALLDGLTIGREGDVNVGNLPGGHYVSRVHATFVKVDGQWAIRDEGSTNFTYVNSVKVEPGDAHKLGNNDLISLGYMSFVYTES